MSYIPANVVDHGRVARLTRTLVLLSEAVALEEQAERQVFPPVEIHTDHPEKQR